MVLIPFCLRNAFHDLSFFLFSCLLFHFLGFAFLTYFLVYCNHDITMGIMLDDEWASKTGRKSVGRRNCTNNLIAYERHFGIASTPCMDWITFIDDRHTLLYMDLENEMDKD